MLIIVVMYFEFFLGFDLVDKYGNYIIEIGNFDCDFIKMEEKLFVVSKIL